MPRCKPSTLRRRGACRDTQTRFRDATVSVEEQYALLVADVPAEWAGYAPTGSVLTTSTHTRVTPRNAFGGR